MRSARVGICAVLVGGLAVASAPNAAMAKSFTVKPGQSIQAAIDGAKAGDTVKVEPGDYTETGPGPAAIRITKSLKLIAKSKLPTKKVRILPGPGQNHGILVEPANDGDPDITGVTIQGFTVEGFQNMGIWLRHVNKFTIQGNESINNLENGIFPTLSANGLVKKNVAYGSQDSALWVEGSQNVRVLNNELYQSPTGLEITISNDITVQQNNVHDNTIGVGLYHPQTAGLTLAERPPPPYGNWHLINNNVHDNNTPTTTQSEVSLVQYGGGILVLGVQNVDLQKNLIQKNDFFGIAMVDYCLVVTGTDFDCSKQTPPPSTLSPTAPDFVQVIKNKLVDNHGNPPDGPYKALAADVQVLEPGAGANNCFSKNKISNPPVTNPSPLTPVCK